VIPVLVMIWASPVDARQVRVAQEAGLPFAANQLRDAVALRVPAVADRDAPIDVTVAPSAPGRVLLDAPGRRLDLWIGELTGGEAARLVAILIVDAVRPPVVLENLEVVAPRPPRLSFYVSPAVNFALTDAGVSFEPNAGVGWALGSRVRLLLSLGYARAVANDPAGNRLATLDVVPVRAGVGVRVGPLEMQGGGLVQGSRATGLGGMVAETYVRPGGWVAVALPLRATGLVRPFLAAGVDGSPGSTEIRIKTQRVLSQGSVAPWAAVGLGFFRGAR
jgi:hypothetical protein